MNVTDGLAVVFLCLAITALLILLGNLIHEGGSAVSLWLLWFVAVVAISAAALWFHNKIGRPVGPGDAQNEQAAGAEAPPIAMPGNAVESTTTEQVDGQGTGHSVGNQNYVNPSILGRSNPIELWFAGAVAAATVVLAVFGAYQLKAIGQQISIADATVKQMRLEQRPWLACNTPDVIITNESKPIFVIVGIENRGHSPAKLTEMAAMAFDAPAIPATDLHIERTFQSWRLEPHRIDIAPGNKTGIIVDHSPVSEKPLVDALKKGTKRLYILGKAAYYDLAGERHEFQWCYVYDGMTGMTAAYGQHNYGD